MKNLMTTLFLFFFLSNYILGQGPTNANRYNVEVRTTNYYYEPDVKLGETNYPTFRFKAEGDTNGSYTILLDDYGNSKHGNNSVQTRWWNEDTPSSRSDGYRTAMSNTNLSSTYYDFTMFAFDNDCGGRSTYNSCCTTFAGFCTSRDESGWNRIGGRYNAKINETGEHYEENQWFQLSGSSDRFRLNIRRTWRYYNGQGQGRPLIFGELASSDFKSHLNYNRSAASGAASSMGYINDWRSQDHEAFDDSPDVTYSFTINEASRLYISTNYGSTNYDTRIHLIKDLPGNNWEVVASSSESGSNTLRSTLNEVVDEGDYFLVIEGDNGATGKFHFYIDNTPVTFDGGEISHAMPWIQNGCGITENISSSEDASINYNESIQYDWYTTVYNGNDVTFTVLDDLGPTLEVHELGSVSGDSLVVNRMASTEHIQRSSNSITFKILDPGVEGDIAADKGHDGKIEGKVVGEGTDIPIVGVKIELLPFENIHGACFDHPIAYTDEEGEFTFNRVYYGLLTSDNPGKFKVVATLQNHGFNKDTTIIAGISFDNPINDNLKSSPIQDTTTFFISGTVYQEDFRSTYQVNCGVDDVQFFVDDGNAEILKLPKSDEFGDYAVDISIIGNYDLRASLEGHSFSPALHSDIEVYEDVTNTDFRDTTVHTLSGSVRAGSCDFIFGSVELLIEDEAGCFIFRDTTDASGNFEIELPARNYTLRITSDQYVDEDMDSRYDISKIVSYFNENIIHIPLDTSDYDIDLIYRQEPTIEIVGITAENCGDNMIYLFDQVDQYQIDIIVTEENTEGCLLDTGSLVIIDQISGQEQTVYPISNGKVSYTITPGDPNFAVPYTKSLSVTARHIDSPNLSTTTQVDGIITGYKQREGTFTTVSPQIPLLILRDPPGDESYSFLEEGTSSSLSLGFSVLRGGAVNTWRKARLGSSVSVAAPLSPISFNVDAWGEIGGSTTIGFSNTTTTEGQITYTHNSRFETSAEPRPESIGQNGDMYLGAAMSLRYAKADILDYDYDNCTVSVSQDLVFGDAQMQTQFFYSEYSIRNSLIPSFTSNKEIAETQDDKEYWQDQIDLWNQMLDTNQELKDIATVNSAYPVRASSEIIGNQSSLSWSGGGSLQEYDMTTVSTTTRTVEFNLEIDRELSAELGFNVAGSGVSGGVNIRTRLELGSSVSSSVQNSRTTGFALKDDDPLDRFETSVYDCPVYGTPIFTNEASITSCPYEPASSPIDAPEITVDSLVRNGIPTDCQNINDPSCQAGFNFTIANRSQDEKTRSYYLDIVPSSNPHNAKINADFPILLENMLYNETRSRYISISREGANPNIYAYEGLEFIVYSSECDPNGEYASSSTRVSVYFEVPCSDVEMQQPVEGWESNENSNNQMTVKITGYDKNNLSRIDIQYNPSGQNSWLTAISNITPAELSDDITTVTWDITNVPDGDYDLRILLACNSGTLFTQRVSGTIDRVAPKVHGVPLPIDDIYEPADNDIIGARFTENIICQNASVVLTDLETSEVLDVQLSCSGDELQIVPIELLELRESSAYRVVLNGVSDSYGNVIDEVRWLFIVGDYVYDPDCSPIELSNNNLNQDAISQSTYRSMTISSDGMISDNHTIGFKAEESITLEPGFEVQSGGGLNAEIENCEND